jgi:hypothetical protein
METLLIGFGVAAVKYTLWFLLFLFGLHIANDFRKRSATNAEQEKPKALFDVAMQLKVRGFIFIFLVGVMSYLSVAETAYRPKTQVSQQNYQLERHLEEVDSAEIVIPEAKTRSSLETKSAEMQAKNSSENEAQKAKFEELEKPE